jgi:predicted lipid-binding transport protein (Tim44 family)
MSGFGFVEYMFVLAGVAASWKLFHAGQPPPADVDVKPANVRWPAMPGDVVPRDRSSSTAAGPFSETLRRICVSCGYGGVERFLEGAKLSYEAIIKGFAAGEIEPLAFLLSPGVFEDFADAIVQRQKREETVELIFIGFRATDIIDAEMADGSARIQVRFVSDLVSVTRDCKGRVVAGHPAMIVTVAERWTFEHELRSAQPNWLLTATEADQ